MIKLKIQLIVVFSSKASQSYAAIKLSELACCFTIAGDVFTIAGAGDRSTPSSSVLQQFKKFMMRTEKKLILSSYFTTDWHLFCSLSAPSYYEQVFAMIILSCPYTINTSLLLLYSFYTYLDYSKEKSINIASSGKGLDSQLTLGQYRHLAVMFLGQLKNGIFF